MKKAILFLTMLLTVTCYAQSDFDIAQSFMNEKGVKLVPNERSLTRGTDTPYSIFNGSEDKGFCIVVNGKVVGYDTENTANTDDLPIQLKELLETYSKIPSKGITRGNGTEYPDWYKRKDVTPIEPMVKTKWGQGYPYNEWCPLGVETHNYVDGSVKYDTIHCPVGCTGTALAQVMSYYRPKGTVVEIPADYDSVRRFLDGKEHIKLDTILPTTDFKWDLMKNTYGSREPLSKEEIDAIAELMLYCARMCNTYWDISSGGECIYDYRGYWYFGYGEDEIYRFDITELSDYDAYDKYLEQGYPLVCSSNGHTFVVDGRNEVGMYHVNFGWGGNSNGYYALYNDSIYNNVDINHQWTNYYFAKEQRNLVFLVKPNQTSDINSQTAYAKPSDESVYNLQGRKVGNSLEGLPKGVYIQNKKKYIIK